MASEIPGQKLTATASGAISGYTFVVAVTGASQEQLTVSAATSGHPEYGVVGVAQSDVADGGVVEVMVTGESKVRAAGAIARGVPVRLGDGGYVEAGVYRAADKNTVGIAKTAATAAQQLVTVLIQAPGAGT